MALIISLREDQASIRRTIQTYPQFRKLLNADGDNLAEQVKILRWPPDTVQDKKLK